MPICALLFRGKYAPTLQMITEQIRIDDEVIDEGDPWVVMDPVWWAVNIYDGEVAYEKRSISK